MALHLSHILLAISLLYQLRTSNGFSWDDCSAAHEPVTFKKISIVPGRIKLPGSFSYEGSVYSSRTLSSVTAEVTLYKKALFWWRIPCFDPSFCTFRICQLSNSPCRISSGYSSSSRSMYFPRPPISSTLLRGYYSATIILKSYGRQVGCANIYFNIDA